MSAGGDERKDLMSNVKKRGFALLIPIFGSDRNYKAHKTQVLAAGRMNGSEHLVKEGQSRASSRTNVVLFFQKIRN